MAQQDDGIDAELITMIGLFGAILVFVLIVMAQVLYYRLARTDYEHKFVDAGSADLQSVTTEWRAALSSYHWVDKNKEIVAVPIEHAMDVVVHQLQRKQPDAPAAASVPASSKATDGAAKKH